MKVELGLVTILGPKNKKGLAMADTELPIPQQRDRQVQNQKLEDLGAKLGVAVEHRKNAVDLGVQPFESLRGQHVIGYGIARMIAHYHGIYANVSGQMKLEFRPDPAKPGTPGVLSADQHEVVIHALNDCEPLKIGGLWVNPASDGDGYFVNLVLRPPQEEAEITALPITQNGDGVFVEIPE